MARKKLNTFTADDAGDDFTPSVRVMKSPVAQEESPKEAKKPVKKAPAPRKAEKAPKPVAEPAKPKLVVEEKPRPAMPVAQEKPAPPKQKPSRVTQQENITREIQRIKSEETGDELVQLVGFNLVDEEFGVDIQQVQEINRMVEITPVPRTPDFVEGVINLRGKVIPVIQLRKRFGHETKEVDKETRIVIVEVLSKVLGLVVDSVSEVLRIPANIIEPPPDIITGVEAEYIKGVAKLENRLLILLDLDKVIRQDMAEVVESSK
jgi:purine-binding chemotaxis protein CheW